MTEDESRDALEAAIRTHVATSMEGAYLCDWVVIASAAMADDPDATVYVSESSHGPAHHRIGLVRYLSMRAEETFMCDDDDH